MYILVFKCIIYTYKFQKVGKNMSTTGTVSQKQSFEELVLSGTTESARVIYNIISTNSDIKVKTLIEMVPYSSRTVRQAIRILLNLGLIKQIPSLEDCRSHYYRVS